MFQLIAQASGITNPAIGNLGNNPEAAASGATFVEYFITIWNAVISLGGLAVLLYFIWGAIDWITAGDDSGKTAKAREKITNSIIGLIILVSSYTIINYTGYLLFGKEFSILAPTFLTPGGTTEQTK